MFDRRSAWLRGSLFVVVVCAVSCQAAGQESGVSRSRVDVSIPKATVANRAVSGWSDARPNLILIMADDLGYGDLGCYGQTQIKTPHLDGLAAEGMRFTQCYAGSTVCAPSRSVLMTGLHTGHTRVRGNTGRGGVRGLGGAEGRVPLAAEDVTVGEVLQAAGYHTAMVGKWGLGEPKTTGLPNDQGFDEWFGYLNQRRAHSYYPDYLWHNGHRFPLPGNLDGRRQQYSHDLLTAHALHWIRMRAAQVPSEPFFLYLPYTVPHDRFEVPDLGGYEDHTEWSDQERTYAAMVSRLDDHVGLLLDLLDELELAESTVVMFCSDNGAANRYEGVFDSSGALRGRKRDLYEGGLRTPMLVRWPGRVAAGKVSDEPWWFADVLPTFAELAGGSVPEGLDGRSVLELWSGEGDESALLKERVFYWEFYERGFSQAVRQGRWKAIRRWSDQRVELYDLLNDPGEQTDLAEKMPERAAELVDLMERSRGPSQAWPSPLDGE